MADARLTPPPEARWRTGASLRRPSGPRRRVSMFAQPGRRSGHGAAAMATSARPQGAKTPSSHRRIEGRARGHWRGVFWQAADWFAMTGWKKAIRLFLLMRPLLPALCHELGLIGKVLPSLDLGRVVDARWLLPEHVSPPLQQFGGIGGSEL